jgi:hypothetical protein
MASGAKLAPFAHGRKQIVETNVMPTANTIQKCAVKITISFAGIGYPVPANEQVTLDR